MEEHKLIEVLNKVLKLDGTSTTESQTAFELLLDIDRRCRLLAADLPSQETRSHSWSGIGFAWAGIGMWRPWAKSPKCCMSRAVP